MTSFRITFDAVCGLICLTNSATNLPFLLLSLPLCDFAGKKKISRRDAETQRKTEEENELKLAL
jgi:hypothetical protein